MSGYIAAYIVLICLSAFFSASEMCFSSANRMRLESAAEGGSRGARIALKVMDRFDDSLSAILIGNNLVNIATSSIASVVVILIAGDHWTWLSTVVTTILVMIFGETMPKIVAKKNANRIAPVFAYPIRPLTYILMPVIWIVVGLVRLFTLPLRGEEQQEDDEAAVEELQSIIETAEDEEVLDENRSELLQAALDFSEVSASEAMTARVDVEAIDIDDDWEEILEVIDNSTHSRLPVYEDSIDNVIGFLYLNHFLKALTENERPDIRSLLMEPLYVYKTIKLPQVLSELRVLFERLSLAYGSGAAELVSVVLELCVLLLLGSMSSCLLFYASLAIGHSLPRHKLLASLGVFLGFGLLSQVLTMLLAVVTGYSLRGFVSVLNLKALAQFGHALLIGGIALNAVYCVVLYLITARMLSRRLDLE